MDKLRAMRAKKVEERAILGFDSLSDAWTKAKSALSGVAGNIADTFRPHLDALKKVSNRKTISAVIQVNHKYPHIDVA